MWCAHWINDKGVCVQNSSHKAPVSLSHLLRIWAPWLANCGPTKDNIHVRSWLPEAVKDRTLEKMPACVLPYRSGGINSMKFWEPPPNKLGLKPPQIQMMVGFRPLAERRLKDGTLVVAFEVQGGREDRISSKRYLRGWGLEWDTHKRCKSAKCFL